MMGNLGNFEKSASGLLLPSTSYKPFRYPWAYDFWQKQQQVHWMPEEVPLGEDLKDWSINPVSYTHLTLPTTPYV